MFGHIDCASGFGLVYWGLTPPQQPGSYQGGESQGLSCTLRMDISPVIRGYRCRVEYAFTKGKLSLSSNKMKCRWMNLAHFRLDISLITYI